MTYALILAGGTGKRMQATGLPKQFLKIYGKPIILFTIEKFINCKEIDSIIVTCIPQYVDYMEALLSQNKVNKPIIVIAGGITRQSSVICGINWIHQNGGYQDDIVVIHDGVRPLVDSSTIISNIVLARQKGAVMTVRPVTESVVVTNSNSALFENFKNREDTFSLTSPQTFRLSILLDLIDNKDVKDAPIQLLDTALIYSYRGGEIAIVKEHNNNLKVTTSEDFYLLKALVELEESKNAFG